jgi:hypothetical protein
MNTNLLAIILLAAFIVVNIAKRLHTAYLFAHINTQEKFENDLQMQQPS